MWVVSVAVPRVLPPGLDPGASGQAGRRRRRLRPDPAHARPAVRLAAPAVRSSHSCTIPAMFERTALPEGPRVISARLPGARSVSIAAYVLAGLAPGDARGGRRRPLHGAPHVQGHGGVPVDAARSARRSRASAARSTRRPTASRPSTGPASRGARPSPGDGRARRADRPAAPRRRRDRPRARRHRRGDPLATSTTRPSTPRSCSSRRCSGTGRWAARSAATRTAIRALPRRRSAPSGARRTGPRTRSSPSPATSSTTRPSPWRRAAFGRGNGIVPAFAPAPALPAGERVLARPARHDAGPARPRRPGAPPRPSRRAGSCGPQRDPRRRDVQPAVPVGPRGAGLAYDVISGIVDYADAGALEVSAGRRPGAAPAALDAILASSPASRDEPVPGRRARQGQGVPLRRPRAADGRDAPPRVLDRRPGGAPRPGADARRGARRRRGRRRPTTSSGWPASCSATRRCGWPSSPRPSTCAASTPPAAATMADGFRRRGRDRRARPERPVASGSPLHLRMGSLALARAELESLAGRGMLDEPALLDLAEVRWRTGDLAGAGEAANALLSAGRTTASRSSSRPSPCPRSAARGGPPARRARPRGHRRPARPAVRRHPAEPRLAGRPPPRPGRPPATPASRSGPPLPARGAGARIPPADARPRPARPRRSRAAGRRSGRATPPRRPSGSASRSGSSLAMRATCSRRSGSQGVDPALALVAGDALRLLGRESEALAAFDIARGHVHSPRSRTSARQPPTPRGRRRLIDAAAGGAPLEERPRSIALPCFPRRASGPPARANRRPRTPRHPGHRRRPAPPAARGTSPPWQTSSAPSSSSARRRPAPARRRILTRFEERGLKLVA